jgi:Cu-processing system permease protein
MMTLALRLVGSGIRDVGRRRWLLAYGLFYAVLTDALFRFGGSGASTVMSLTNVVLALVPLVSIVFGTMYLYHAREFIQLMLAQPVGRGSLYVGLFGGLAIPLAASFLAGVGVPLAWHGGVADAPAAVLVLLSAGLALSLVFTGLAFVIALGFHDRAAGLAAAILVWLGATVLYDGLVLMAVMLLRDYPLEQPLVAVMLLNPVDLARVLLVLQFDLGALAGYTGAVFERFFGTVQGSVWSGAALLLWIVAPLGAGLRLFARKDF